MTNFFFACRCHRNQNFVFNICVLAKVVLQRIKAIQHLLYQVVVTVLREIFHVFQVVQFFVDVRMVFLVLFDAIALGGFPFVNRPDVREYSFLFVFEVFQDFVTIAAVEA